MAKQEIYKMGRENALVPQKKGKITRVNITILNNYSLKCVPFCMFLCFNKRSWQYTTLVISSQ